MYKTASIIKKLCIRDGITIKEVEKQIGLSNGSIMKWESSSPKIENLEKVANYFKVPLECLIGKPCAMECDVCGYDYVANCNSSELAHEKRHKKCLAAISKFGFWWSYKKRERLKANARNKINYEKLTVAEKINEYEVVFKSHFSRSVESSQFNLTHPCLNEFIAMLLYQKQFYNKIDNETYNALVNKYGKKPGIAEGTTYYICDADSRTPMYSRKKHSTIIVSLDNLFKRMKELNVSKNMLSDEIGVSTETVNNWRNGQSTPNTIKISMIADYLDCSIDYLLGRTDNPNSHKTTPVFNEDVRMAAYDIDNKHYIPEDDEDEIKTT